MCVCIIAKSQCWVVHWEDQGRLLALPPPQKRERERASSREILPPQINLCISPAKSAARSKTLLFYRGMLEYGGGMQERGGWNE